MRRFSLRVAVALSLLLAGACFAQQTVTTTVPNLIRYGGTLKDATGAPIATAAGVTFAIYKQQDGGAAVWMETQNVTPDASGQYSVLLGSTTATGLPSDLFSQEEQRWLGVQVQGQAEQPRVLLVSVPYAFKAHEAETLAGRSISDFVLAKDLNSTNSSAKATTVPGSGSTQPASGKANTKSPSNQATAQGPTNFSGTTSDQIVSVVQSGTGKAIVASSSTGNAIVASTSSTTTTTNALSGTIPGAGVAILGHATSASAQGYGIQGTSDSTIGIGLLGFATATTGSTYGLKGYSSSTSGTGVRGLSTAATGVTTGISASVASPAGTAGIFNNTAGGKILSGLNNGSEKFAVDGNGNVTAKGTINAPTMSGTTSAPTGVGLTGNATNTTGGNFGVLGETASTNGIGVSGMSNAASGGNAGVYGQNNSNGGWAIYGYEAATTGQVVGVEGLTSSTGDFSVGVLGYEGSANGQVFGVHGITVSTTDLSAGVAGNANGTSGVTHGVNGRTLSTTTGAAGVHGAAAATTGQVYGVTGGTSSTTDGAAGVNGFEGSTSGQVYGVFGSTNSTTTSAAGVSGYEGATTGQVVGVAGSTNSTTNYAAGVSGYEGATSGLVFGVNGGTNSTTTGAAGVGGFAGATSGQVFGVSGGSASTEGVGVAGYASASSGLTFGVQGSTSSSQGIGVVGWSPGGVGVAGLNQSCTPSGCTPTTGTAGQFTTAAGGTILQGISGGASKFTVDSSGNGFYAGNLHVTGAITAGTKDFKIDDPVDPANKYLYHTSVESPDMLNIYNGSVRLNARGEAWVVLPAYFESLNRDFQYVLTALGRPQPYLYIAQKVSGNRFKVAGGKPYGEVSWQVTGVRHDAFAEAYRGPVEEEKPTAERGTYLHPELFTPGNDKSLNARLQR